MTKHSSNQAFELRLKAFLLATLMLIIALPAHAEPGHRDILVFAASSLAPPLEQIALIYEARTGVIPRFSFASSAVLARQIEYGAPADLFVTAHPQWLDRLVDHGRIDMTDTRAIAGNRLVVAKSRQEAADTTDIRTLLLAGDAGRIITGDPDSVPLGLYARESLMALGLWEAVSPRLAGAANARAALLQVERGLAPLGILFASDAAGSDRAMIVAEMPAGSYGPISYLAAPVKGAPSGDAAFDFLDFLASAEAVEIFKSHGFSRPE